MRLLDLIRNRYSCRTYSDKAVTPQQMEYIKECVRLAPSAVNKQPWRFRIVDTDEGRKKIRQCYDREWFKSPQIYVIATVLHNEEWVRTDGKAHGNGYTDGTFRPNNKITRAEAMTLVNRVLKRLPETAEDLHNDMIKWSDNSDTSAWYYLAVQEATNSHYYDLKENKHEKWSKLRETRDWTELEK